MPGQKRGAPKATRRSTKKLKCDQPSKLLIGGRCYSVPVNFKTMILRLAGGKSVTCNVLSGGDLELTTEEMVSSDEENLFTERMQELHHELEERRKDLIALRKEKDDMEATMFSSDEIGDETYQKELWRIVCTQHLQHSRIRALKKENVVFDVNVTEIHTVTATVVPQGVEATVSFLPTSIIWCPVESCSEVALQAETKQQTSRKRIRRLVGDGYYYGLGVPMDYKKAFRWYLRAAKTGNAAGMFCVGHCYHFGYGVVDDHKQAKKWYTKAANGGNIDANFNLAYLLDQRNEIEEAIEWYQKSAKLGDARSQHNLGLIYQHGREDNVVVEINYARAITWYVQSARQGDLDSVLGLCEIAQEIGNTRAQGHYYRILRDHEYDGLPDELNPDVDDN